MTILSYSKNIFRHMRQNKDYLALKGWREECYDVATSPMDPQPLFKMERAATCKKISF